ncbi:MAG: preprotein translocase subunit SecE, partial [Buchnera aphidicola]|nr:preprotein translocase subunit SecE [Buchnera aphidicola]MDE5285207.1 preprotein translocase subunit SecE [Buchnera aphidicola]
IISIFIFSIISIIIFTKKGQKGLSFIKDSKQEIYKITWPKYKETIYTTCIIIFVTIILSIILWGVDNIIFRLITSIINLRF